MRTTICADMLLDDYLLSVLIQSYYKSQFILWCGKPLMFDRSIRASYEGIYEWEFCLHETSGA
jgi:hypothetical protein